jgi:hypothetical protein
MNAWMDG